MIGSIKKSLYTFLFRFDEAMFEKHHDIDRISKEYASEQVELEGKLISRKKNLNHYSNHHFTYF